MTNVEDLMSTNVVTLEENETVTEAAISMKFCEIRHLPVVDQRNRLVGIVSNRDLLRALARSGSNTVPIRRIMVREVRTVRPMTSAASAARLLIDEKIGALPVVSEEGELVGIITETDFLEVAFDALNSSAPAKTRSELIDHSMRT